MADKNDLKLNFSLTPKQAEDLQKRIVGVASKLAGGSDSITSAMEKVLAAGAKMYDGLISQGLAYDANIQGTISKLHALAEAMGKIKGYEKDLQSAVASTVPTARYGVRGSFSRLQIPAQGGTPLNTSVGVSLQNPFSGHYANTPMSSGVAQAREAATAVFNQSPGKDGKGPRKPSKGAIQRQELEDYVTRNAQEVRWKADEIAAAHKASLARQTSSYKVTRARATTEQREDLSDWLARNRERQAQEAAVRRLNEGQEQAVRRTEYRGMRSQQTFESRVNRKRGNAANDAQLAAAIAGVHTGRWTEVAGPAATHIGAFREDMRTNAAAYVDPAQGGMAGNNNIIQGGRGLAGMRNILKDSQLPAHLRAAFRMQFKELEKEFRDANKEFENAQDAFNTKNSPSTISARRLARWSTMSAQQSSLTKSSEATPEDLAVNRGEQWRLLNQLRSTRTMIAKYKNYSDLGYQDGDVPKDKKGNDSGGNLLRAVERQIKDQERALGLEQKAAATSTKKPKEAADAAEAAAKSLKEIIPLSDRIGASIFRWAAPAALAYQGVLMLKNAMAEAGRAALDFDRTLYRIAGQVSKVDPSIRKDMFKNIVGGAKYDAVRTGMSVAEAADVHTVFNMGSTGSLADRRSLAATVINLDQTGVMTHEEAQSMLGPMRTAGYDAKGVKNTLETMNMLQGSMMLTPDRMKAFKNSVSANMPGMRAMGMDMETVLAAGAFEASSTNDMVMGSKLNRISNSFRNPKVQMNLREILSRQGSRSMVGEAGIEDIVNSGNPMSSIQLLQDQYKKGNITQSEMTRITQKIDMWSAPGTMKMMMGGMDETRDKVRLASTLASRGLGSSDRQMEIQTQSLASSFERLKAALTVAIGEGVEPLARILAKVVGFFADSVGTLNKMPVLLATMGTAVAALTTVLLANTAKAMWMNRASLAEEGIGRFGGKVVSGALGIGASAAGEVAVTAGMSRAAIIAARASAASGMAANPLVRGIGMLGPYGKIAAGLAIAGGVGWHFYQKDQEAKQEAIETRNASSARTSVQSELLRRKDDDEIDDRLRKGKATGLDVGNRKASIRSSIEQKDKLQEFEYVQKVLAGQIEAPSMDEFKKNVKNSDLIRNYQEYSTANDKYSERQGESKAVRVKPSVDKYLGMKTEGMKRYLAKVSDEYGINLNYDDPNANISSANMAGQQLYLTASKGLANLHPTDRTELGRLIDAGIKDIGGGGEATLNELVKLSGSNLETSKLMASILADQLSALLKIANPGENGLAYKTKADAPEAVRHLLVEKKGVGFVFRDGLNAEEANLVQGALTTRGNAKGMSALDKEWHDAGAKMIKARQSQDPQAIARAQKLQESLQDKQQRGEDTNNTFVDYLSPVQRRLSLMEAMGAAGNFGEVFTQHAIIEGMDLGKLRDKTIAKSNKVLAYDHNQDDAKNRMEDILAQYDVQKAKMGLGNMRKIIHRGMPALLREGLDPNASQLVAGVHSIMSESEIDDKARQDELGKYTSAQLNGMSYEDMQLIYGSAALKANKDKGGYIKQAEVEAPLILRGSKLQKIDKEIADYKATNTSATEATDPKLRALVAGKDKWLAGDYQKHFTKEDINEKEYIQAIAQNLGFANQKAGEKAVQDQKKHLLGLQLQGIGMGVDKVAMGSLFTSAMGTNPEKEQARVTLLDEQIAGQKASIEAMSKQTDMFGQQTEATKKLIDLEMQRVLADKDVIFAMKANAAGDAFAGNIIGELVSGGSGDKNKRMGMLGLSTFRQGLTSRLTDQFTDKSKLGGGALSELGSFIFDPAGYGGKKTGEQKLLDSQARLVTALNDLQAKIVAKTAQDADLMGVKNATSLSGVSFDSKGFKELKAQRDTLASKKDLSPEEKVQLEKLNEELSTPTSSDSVAASDLLLMPQTPSALSGGSEATAVGGVLGVLGNLFGGDKKNKNPFWSQGTPSQQVGGPNDGKITYDNHGAGFTKDGKISAGGAALAVAQVGMGIASGAEQARGYGAGVRDKQMAAGGFAAVGSAASIWAASATTTTSTAATAGPWIAAAALVASLVMSSMAAQEANAEDNARKNQTMEKQLAEASRQMTILTEQRNQLGMVAEHLLAIRSEVANAFRGMPSSSFLSGRFASQAPIQVANLNVHANNPAELSTALAGALSRQVARGT